MLRLEERVIRSGPLLHLSEVGPLRQQLRDIEAGVKLSNKVEVSALDSHEIARGEAILYETARLVFKLVLSHHDCHQGVSDGMRARVDAHDVVDRMVRVTKMLRGALVSALMRRSRKEMIALFLFNSSVFVRGRAPRALGLDVATRLPGELR